MVSERARNRGGREERNDKDRKNKVILTEQNDGVERIIPTTAFCNRKIEKKKELNSNPWWHNLQTLSLSDIQNFLLSQKEQKLNHLFSWYKSEASRLSLFSSKMRQILKVFICTFLLNLSNGDTKYSLKVQFCFITRWSGGSTVGVQISPRAYDICLQAPLFVGIQPYLLTWRQTLRPPHLCCLASLNARYVKAWELFNQD